MVRIDRRSGRKVFGEWPTSDPKAAVIWEAFKPESEPRRGELFRQLLEYNARDLVHGSYGLEGDHVVLTDTLELENLDFSEFEASFESMTLALASHLGALASYRER